MERSKRMSCQENKKKGDYQKRYLEIKAKLTAKEKKLKDAKKEIIRRR